MNDSEKDKIEYLIKKVHELSEDTRRELAMIKRGIYGDPINKVIGLIDRQDMDEVRIKSLEESKYKYGVWIGGIIVFLQLMWNFIKNRFL